MYFIKKGIEMLTALDVRRDIVLLMNDYAEIVARIRDKNLLKAFVYIKINYIKTTSKSIHFTHRRMVPADPAGYQIQY